MSNVTSHYDQTSAGDERPGLARLIAERLEASGVKRDQLTVKDLASVDEFHIRGRQATLELITAMKLKRDTHLLDIGCGLGGPARTAVEMRNCQVTGIDLTKTFTDAAREITQWLGMQDKITFQTGDATSMPFDDNHFEAAMTLHVAMNIAAKDKLYRETARVLKPGAVFGIFDVIQGEGGEPFYPTPWARQASDSHLIGVSKLTSLLEQAGFAVQALVDSSDECALWLAARAERSKNKPAPLSFGLFLGDAFPLMIQNLARNLNEKRVRIITCIARLPAA